jgi:hypothetical protein
VQVLGGHRFTLIISSVHACVQSPRAAPSCELPGHIKSTDVIVDVSLQLTRSGGTRNHPLADQWWYPGGRGPADLYLDMVGAQRGVGGTTLAVHAHACSCTHLLCIACSDRLGVHTIVPIRSLWLRALRSVVCYLHTLPRLSSCGSRTSLVQAHTCKLATTRRPLTSLSFPPSTTIRVHRVPRVVRQRASTPTHTSRAHERAPGNIACLEHAPRSQLLLCAGTHGRVRTSCSPWASPLRDSCPSLSRISSGSR